jgi:hypothetical protein
VAFVPVPHGREETEGSSKANRAEADAVAAAVAGMLAAGTPAASVGVITPYAAQVGREPGWGHLVGMCERLRALTPCNARALQHTRVRVSGCALVLVVCVCMPACRVCVCLGFWGGGGRHGLCAAGRCGGPARPLRGGSAPHNCAFLTSSITASSGLHQRHSSTH